ncbi:MAG TPA: dihydropteroate synthase [Spirochaetota bacterium]|nr:dihydropteroate synthase [Spirochaetota bacterium]HOM37711.1 dihydropteroate synthase [Spirochaetota bacterium]HPQ49669.1 dihydropteroate synthase [Spirochaetota bacterium]
MIDFKNKKYVMGIINITPDSFFDGGKYNSLILALNRVESIISEGADIIDIGAESSRPGSKRIDAKEELKRLIPVLKEIRKNYSNIIISIDTYKPEVARIALEEGADIINDIYGLRKEGMIDIIAKYNSYCIIMHMKGDPENMQINPYYDNVVEEIASFFEERIREAEEKGIKRDKIIIDPGIGFGKRLEDNINILKNIKYFKDRFKLPVLIGLSRKSMIGQILNNSVEERKNGSIILNTISFMNGADIIRVHDVKESVEIKKIISFLNYN